MKKPKRKTVLVTGFTVFLLLMLGFSVFFFLNFNTASVSGPSMEPTLKNGRRLLFTRAYWLVGDIRKNDIIVFVSPDDPKESVIKRVAGLPGDKIDPLNAPNDWGLARGPFTVPEGTLYVLGDNAEVSEDSRDFGPIPRASVKGKIVILGSPESVAANR